MFDWFKETADDKYVRALRDADGEWEISQEMRTTSVKFTTTNDVFIFVKEDWFLTKNFYEKIQNSKRIISEKLFKKIYQIAEESVSHKQIQKVGGYILDEDLRRAIADTKKILGAESQIEVLYSQIENIRNKYR